MSSLSLYFLPVFLDCSLFIWWPCRNNTFNRKEAVIMKGFFQIYGRKYKKQQQEWRRERFIFWRTGNHFYKTKEGKFFRSPELWVAITDYVALNPWSIQLLFIDYFYFTTETFLKLETVSGLKKNIKRSDSLGQKRE